MLSLFLDPHPVLPNADTTFTSRPMYAASHRRSPDWAPASTEGAPTDEQVASEFERIYHKGMYPSQIRVFQSAWEGFASGKGVLSLIHI